MSKHSDVLENINKWIDALESDVYQQTTGRLRRNDAMCCLGVLCQVSNISNWVYGEYIGETKRLPSKVAEWIGFSSRKGIFYITPEWIQSLPEHIKNKLESTIKNNYYSSHTYLVTLNDNDWTFKEIAELIRFNPPGLFNDDIYDYTKDLLKQEIKTKEAK